LGNRERVVCGLIAVVLIRALLEGRWRAWMPSWCSATPRPAIAMPSWSSAFPGAGIDSNFPLFYRVEHGRQSGDEKRDECFGLMSCEVSEDEAG
jgi:hypothetical protein